METARSPHILALLTSVCHYDSPQKLMEPAYFCSVVTESTKWILDLHTTNLCEIHSDFCSDSKQCITSLDIASLSALNSIYSFTDSEKSVESRERNTSTSTNEDYDAEQYDVHRREVSDIKESINSSENVAVESREDGNGRKHAHGDCKASWFHSTSDLLHKNGIIETLVKCLGCCRFTSYLAKKALVSAVKGDHVEVLQVLRSAESLLGGRCKYTMAVLELVRDLMSRRTFKNHETVIDKTCVWFKDSQMLYFVNSALDCDNKTFRTTEGLFEYLQCIQKSLRYITSQKNIELYSDFVNTISNIIVSKFEPFFSLQRASGGHLLCLKFVKIVDSILNIQYINSKKKIPECILDVAANLKVTFFRAFELSHKNGLFSAASFVENSKQLDVQAYRSSVLFRGIILCILKASALLCTNSEILNDCVNTLKSVWWKVRSLFEKTDPFNGMSDNLMTTFNDNEKSLLWLPSVFADQDDQWINALLCLLVIRQRIIKSPSSSDSCTVGDQCQSKTVAQQQGLQHACISTLEEGSLKSYLPFETHHNHTSRDYSGEAKAILAFSSSHLEHKPKEQFHSSLIPHSECNQSVENSDNDSPDKHLTSKGEMEQHGNEELLGLKEFLIALCPHRLFLQFSHFIHYDHLVISDFLTSPETEFLEYFSRYLHILLHEWESVKKMWTSEMSTPRVTAVTPEGIEALLDGYKKGNEKDTESSALLGESISFGSVTSHTRERKRQACSLWIKRDNEESSSKKICRNLGESQVSVPLTSLVSYSGSDDSETSNDETDQDNLSEHQLDKKYDYTGEDDSLDSFHQTHETHLDNIMSMLIRLRYHIERLKDKKLFPYTADPLLKLLLSCEDKYDTAVQTSPRTHL